MKNITFDYDDSFKPHQKQLRFFEAGKYHRFRLALWGNRTGKTFGVGKELFYDSSGMYPSWWPGYRYSRPIQIYCLTENIDLCKRNLVRLLFEGDKENKPAIPPEFVIRMEPSPCKIHTRYIQHVSGGESVFSFMSYKSGAQAMQGFKADKALFDERPPLSVFDEMTKRLASFDGEKTQAIITTWPEGGYTDIVHYFMSGTEENYIMGLDAERDLSKNPKIEKPNKFIYYSHASWDDNPYLSDSEKEMMEFSTPPHLLEARRSGIPYFGSGNVFYMPQSKYICDYIEPKKHYAYLLAVDPAVTENGFWGAVLLAYDRDIKPGGVIYVMQNYYMSGISKSQHAFNLEKMLPFPRCPVVIDPAGGGEDQITRQGMADYLSNELRMNVHKAKKGKDSVELGITVLCEKMLDDGLKIVYNSRDHTGCVKLIEQIMRYARNDKNEIIKANFDHIIDALRYGVTHIDLSKKKDEMHREFYQHQGYQAESSWY